MNKIVLAITAATFFLASCNSNKKTALSAESTTTDSVALAPEDAPVIKFEKSSFDFGKITAGEKVSYDFKFTNTGKSPLIISNATATCGCTVPDYPHEPILPGASSVIKVVFNSEGKSGMQNKVVTITSNTVPTATEVFLVGEVIAKK